MSIGSYYPRSARTLPGLPSAANIPLPSLSLTTAADLAMANFARSRSAKSRTSPGSSLRTKAILQCKSILLESTFA